MTKRFLPGKLLPVWAAVSAVLIVVGIVLYSLFGFNYIASEKKTVEIGYDAFVEIGGLEEDLQNKCEDVFASAKISFVDKRIADELNSNYISPTGDRLLIYTFGADTDEKTLASAVESIENAVKGDAQYANADVYVSAHTVAGERFFGAAWRGAVALAVAAIVALVYVGFRFGVGSAVAGLVACVNDVLLTLSVFAIARIPVYAYGPVLFAGIALVLSLILWLAQCMKMRENFKEPAYSALSAEEAVAQSCLSARKFVLVFVLSIAAVLVVLGAVATSGMRLFMLPALLPLAASVYSSFLLAPAVLVPIKKKVDRFKTRHKRYVGKKKAAETEE